MATTIPTHHPQLRFPDLLKNSPNILEKIKSTDSILGVFLIILASLNFDKGLVGPFYLTIAGTIALWAAFSQREKTITNLSTILGFMLVIGAMIYVGEAA